MAWLAQGLMVVLCEEQRLIALMVFDVIDDSSGRDASSLSAEAT
jgi:hypothetical protein